MKSEWQANLAMCAFYQRNEWAGDLGVKRTPIVRVVRPSLLQRLFGWRSL